MLAVNEGWPGKTISEALHLATDSILITMQQDLQDIRQNATEQMEYTSFSGLDLQGNEKEFNAHAIGIQGLHTIYRDMDGNLYSVP
jgi:hypothetical protein